MAPLNVEHVKDCSAKDMTPILYSGYSRLSRFLFGERRLGFSAEPAG